VLLLAGALLAELPHHLFPEARGFGEHVVQPIEHLFQLFRADWAVVSHGPGQITGGNAEA